MAAAQDPNFMTFYEVKALRDFIAVVQKDQSQRRSDARNSVRQVRDH
jgi:hypothetical protein